MEEKFRLSLMERELRPPRLICFRILLAARPVARPTPSLRLLELISAQHTDSGRQPGFPMLKGRRSEHDLCGISVSKAAPPDPRPRDGVCGGGTGRPHRAVARESHLVLPLAQCLAAPAAT